VLKVFKARALHGSKEVSTKGMMGDIRGKPSEEDLEKIRKDAEELAHSL
jgi:hypothetical protein